MSETEILSRKYRSDVEILWEIMNAVVASGERGIKKTHLMYRTNLNSKMLAKYLDMLIKGKVVEEIERRKERIIRLGPNGSLAYVNLNSLNRIFFATKRTDEENYVIEQIDRLKEKGWAVYWGFTVIGRSDMPILVDGFISKGNNSYIVQVAVNRTETETKASLLTLYLSLAETSVKGMFITDLIKMVEEIISPDLKERIVVVPAKPLENIYEKISKYLT